MKQSDPNTDETMASSGGKGAAHPAEHLRMLHILYML